MPSPPLPFTTCRIAARMRLRGPRRTYHDADNVSSRRNEALRIGVIGGGMVAQAEHLPHLNELQDRYRIAALAEPSPTVRDAMCARFGIPAAHADWRSLIEGGGLDAVLIASPAGTHVEIVLAALEAGLHVFCEKPLAITVGGRRPDHERSRSSRQGRAGRLHEASRPGRPARVRGSCRRAPKSFAT